MSQLDILCLATWHGVGGAQMNAAMLTGEFARRGLKAEAAFIFEREPFASLGDAPIKVINKSYNRLFAPYLIAKAWLYVFRRRPRVVFGFHPLSNIVGAIYRFANPKARFIGTQRITSGRQSRFTAAVERVIGCTPIYDAQIAVTNAVKESFSDYPEAFYRKIKVVHNGTPPLIPFRGSKSEARSNLNMTDGRKILGCVGRLHDQKNFGFAIEVMKMLPDCLLFIAGDGPSEASLKRLAEEMGVGHQVIFLGSLDGIDLTTFYRALDVLLFPSVYEGFGRVLVEAFSQEVFVIANDIEVVREVGGDACLIAPTDAGQWAELVHGVFADENRATEIRQKAKQRATEFTVDRMVHEYLKIADMDKERGIAC